jgi:hypothetical protein
MNETLQKKVDARGRFQLMKGEISGPVEILVRTAEPVSAQERRALRDAGCDIHSIMGNILSAETDVENLTEVARLPFVQKIELGRQLFEEEIGPEV